MLNITTLNRQSVGRVVNYYGDAADDYYAKEGGASAWEGKGAKALGLSGEVDRARFAELLDGKVDERTRLKRSPPLNADARKERLAYDFTFSAPKGVTLQALLGGDKRVIAAHEAAVSAAVAEAEGMALARTTRKGKVETEATGNLVVARFRHETSRARDPQLHTHAVVLNMTQRADGQWRSLTNDRMVKALNHLGDVYRADLAAKLQELGYTIRREKDGTFDLAHFTPEQIRQFSKRSGQIEERLAAQGLTRETATGAEKDQASLSTRGKKRSVDRDELFQAWQAEAKGLGLDFSRRDWAGPEAGGGEIGRSKVERPVKLTPAEHAAEAIRFAVDRHTERNAIVLERTVVASAMRHAVGNASAADIKRALEAAIADGQLIKEQGTYRSKNPGKGKDHSASSEMLTRSEWIAEVVKTGKGKAEAAGLVDRGIATGRLERAEVRFTTKDALARERTVLGLEEKGRGAVKAVLAPAPADKALAKHKLNEEQKKAVHGILTTKNRYVGVQGFAGTGKSHMLKSAIEVLQANGAHVTALAPYASQVKSMQELGVGEARTLASFLHAGDKKIHKGSVVLIDEAGVIPARQMAKTMQEIEKAGARAVLLGDVAQTKAIEAGRPFDQLQKAGMQTARMVDIQRQQNPVLREAVQLAAEGKTAMSVAKVSDVRVMPEHASRYASVANDYVQLAEKDRQKTLIVTGTNDSRRQINDLVRDGLGLVGKGTEHTLLGRQDTTQAERRHSRYYEVGSVIVPERDDKKLGLKRGTMYEVIDTGPGNRLTVKEKGGETIAFSPTKVQLSVYSRDRAEVTVGDRVRITRNDKELDVANGDQFAVKRVNKAEITLESASGRLVTLPTSRPVFLSHAYVSTVHSAQGLTSDRVLINLESQSRTTTKDVYYVGISRARNEATIYTDNHTQMVKAIGRDPEKAAALDLRMRERSTERQAERQEVKQERQEGRKWLGWLRSDGKWFRRSETQTDREIRRDEATGDRQQRRETQDHRKEDRKHQREEKGAGL